MATVAQALINYPAYNPLPILGPGEDSRGSKCPTFDDEHEDTYWHRKSQSCGARQYIIGPYESLLRCVHGVCWVISLASNFFFKIVTSSFTRP